MQMAHHRMVIGTTINQKTVQAYLTASGAASQVSSLLMHPCPPAHPPDMTLDGKPLAFEEPPGVCLGMECVVLHDQ